MSLDELMRRLGSIDAKLEQLQRMVALLSDFVRQEANHLFRTAEPGPTSADMAQIPTEDVPMAGDQPAPLRKGRSRNGQDKPKGER